MTNGKSPTTNKNGLKPAFPPINGRMQSAPPPPKKSGIFLRLKNYLLSSTVSMEEVLRRRSLIHILVIAGQLFQIMIIGATLTLPDTPAAQSLGSKNATIGLVLCSIIVYSVVYWLNRSYHVYLAGWLLISCVTTLIIIGSFAIWNNYLTNFLAFFLLGILVTLSGQVIDQVAPFVVATIGSVAFVISFWTDNFYAIPGDEPISAIQTTSVFLCAGAIYIFAALSWSNARTTKNIFARMEEQNRLLVEANQRLSQNFQSNLTTANFIAGLSDQLSSLSVDQSSQTEQQVRAITKVSTTLSIVGDTARRLADASGEVFRTSETALQTAEEGGRSIGESIDGIETLRQNVEHIAGIVYDLSQQSNRIGQIVELITELADETNLLALNATIEAAGAGEYGKRFAVVAQEVQTLANRSRVSARDVQNILSKITDSIKNSLEATEQGLEVAQQLSETAGRSGEAIEKIIAAIENTTGLSRQIYQATQVQSNVTEDAIKMITEVSLTSQEAASRAAELARAGQQLNETSTKLKR
jgi:methyl-accepting chemotaxis protein